MTLEESQPIGWITGIIIGVVLYSVVIYLDYKRRKTMGQVLVRDMKKGMRIYTCMGGRVTYMVVVSHVEKITGPGRTGYACTARIERDGSLTELYHEAGYDPVRVKFFIDANGCEDSE